MLEEKLVLPTTCLRVMGDLALPVFFGDSIHLVRSVVVGGWVLGEEVS